jgi:hypothetical protein
MHIEVNDCYFLDLVTVLTQSVRCRQCYVVDEAEAVGACLAFVLRMEGFSENSRMMAGWSRCAKSIPAVLCHHLINCFDGCPGRNQCSLPSLLRGDRILVIKLLNPFVSRSLELRYVFHYLLNVVEVMNFEDVRNFGSLIHVLLYSNVRLALLGKFDSVC